jgi:hypothetical protein
MEEVMKFKTSVSIMSLAEQDNASTYRKHDVNSDLTDRRKIQSSINLIPKLTKDDSESITKHEQGENLKVFIRVRPAVERELGDSENPFFSIVST